VAAVLDRPPTAPPGGGPPIAAVRRRRWAIALGVLALVIAIPAVITSWPAGTATTLTPAQLRDRVTASSDVPWSGYAEASGGLNLPDVAQFSDVTTLLSGTSRLRVWYAAPDTSRVDQLYPTGERSRYTTPTGQVVWDYGAQLLTYVRRDPTVRLPRPDDLPPPQLARRLLSGTAPTDALSPLPARRLAGVDAAGFRVTVADPRTSVGAVDVWADPGSGLPVAVELRTKDTAGQLAAGPVVVSTMLELDRASPDPSVFVPHAGPGAGVTRSPTSDLFGILGRGNPASVPDRVDGVDREPPERRFAAIGQYGTSLSQLIVVPLPPDLATTLLSNIGKAGAASRTIPVSPPPAAFGRAGNAQAGALVSPLLQLAVVRVGGRAWAIGGLVPDAVLDRAVSDVAGSAT
jgi:hypothetical protein